MTITALKALLGASLGLGAIDLAVIDFVLAPEVVASRSERPPVAPALVAAATAPMPAEPAMPAPPAAPVAPAPSFERVYFATKSAELDATARGTLDLLAARGGSFVLEGHADYRGDERSNVKLSRQRALAVQDYLVTRGVDRDRIDARAAGEGGATQANELWRDRRVDIEVTGGPR